MAGSIGIITGVAVANSGVSLLARILGYDQQLVTQATFSAITYNARDLTTQTTIASGQVLAVGSVIFNAIQQDSRWDKDSQVRPGRDGRWGYNFLAYLPATLFPKAFDIDPLTNLVTPHLVQVDVNFTPVLSTWPAFVQPFAFKPIPTWLL